MVHVTRVPKQRRTGRKMYPGGAGELLETLDFLVREYANEDDEKLTADAQQLKRALVATLEACGWRRG